MPGFSLVIENQRFSTQNQMVISDAIKKLQFFPDYVTHNVWDNEGSKLFFTAYPEYPRSIFDNSEFLILLEGKIYGTPNKRINYDICNFLKGHFQDNSTTVTEEYLRWLSHLDGDFIVCAIEKRTGRLVIFNDVFGRLPLYYYNNLSGGTAILSREISFILHLLPETSLDLHGIAEYMLFGYPLGNRTLFKDVQRIPPAAIISVDSEGTVSQQSKREVNFSKLKSHSDRSSDGGKILAREFIQSCKKRFHYHDELLLSLSGGLDSRAVAAALRRIKAKFYARTFMDASRLVDYEIGIAQHVAKALDITEWKPLALQQADYQDILTLLKMKYGLNSLGMSHIFKYLESLHCEFGRGIWHVTGDGGDKMLPDNSPTTLISDIDDLVHYIIRENSRFNLEEVSTLTQVGTDKIIHGIKERIKQYPEDDFTDMYDHFLVYERANKWLFEGVDRNRYFCWTVSPFWSYPFFSKAMSYSKSEKKGYSLYRDFLKALSPDIAVIPYAQWGLPITSLRFRMANILFDIASKIPTLKNTLLRILGKKSSSRTYPEDSKVLSLLLNQIQKDSPVWKYLSRRKARSILENPLKGGWTSNAIICTIGCLVESIFCGKSATLENKAELEFRSE